MIKVGACSLIRYDDEKVPITIRLSRAARAASEQPDLLRMPVRNDAVEEWLDRAKVEKVSTPIL